MECVAVIGKWEIRVTLWLCTLKARGHSGETDVGWMCHIQSCELNSFRMESAFASNRFDKDTSNSKKQMIF